MEPLKQLWRRALGTKDITRRLAVLEAEVQECRQLNLRLAELTDVVMELLVPIANQDEERIAQVLERYRVAVSDPPPRQ